MRIDAAAAARVCHVAQSEIRRTSDAISSSDFHWRFFSRSATVALRGRGVGRFGACNAGVLGGGGRARRRRACQFYSLQARQVSAGSPMSSNISGSCSLSATLPGCDAKKSAQMRRVSACHTSADAQAEGGDMCGRQPVRRDRSSPPARWPGLDFARKRACVRPHQRGGRGGGGGSGSGSGHVSSHGVHQCAGTAARMRGLVQLDTSS